MAHTGKPTLALTIKNRIEQEQCSVSMAGIQQDLQASLVQLVKSFEVQADTLQSLMTVSYTHLTLPTKLEV